MESHVVRNSFLQFKEQIHTVDIVSARSFLCRSALRLGQCVQMMLYTPPPTPPMMSLLAMRVCS